MLHPSQRLIFLPIRCPQAAYPSEAVPLTIVLLVLLLVSRAFGVIPMALLHNVWGSSRLSNTDLFIIWWSGLTRGAVSVALVYFYFDNQALDGHRATVIARWVSYTRCRMFAWHERNWYEKGLHSLTASPPH